MFVSKCRLILKTCGTTTPLHCLETLLRLVKEYTGYDDVAVRYQKLRFLSVHATLRRASFDVSRLAI
jgi:S-adenosylmethionine decarboxylase